MVLATRLGRRLGEGPGRGSSAKKPPPPAAVNSDVERIILNLPLTQQTLAKPRVGVFSNYLTLYICIVLAAALTSYAVWARTRSIFSCPATGYTADRYIAYCGGANYGDYEHGAFWFDLEHALDFASKADVLFLGTSRMEKAFSRLRPPIGFPPRPRGFT